MIFYLMMFIGMVIIFGICKLTSALNSTFLNFKKILNLFVPIISA